jgi:hypothetical protein
MTSTGEVQSPFFYSKKQLVQLNEERGYLPQVMLAQISQNSDNLKLWASNLNLPYYTVASAFYLYHRFIASYGLVNYAPKDVILACLSLAMKIEETVKKLVILFNIG